MQPHRRRALACLAALLPWLPAAGCVRPAATADPIEAIPPTQQRTITRNEIGFRWPFTVGVGTVGCDAGAVVFRHDGKTYALNDAAARRYPAVESLRRIQGAGPPTDPVSRLTQDTRQRIFAERSACRAADAAATCREQVRTRHNITADELTRIEAEGTERRWPPIKPVFMSLEPVVQAGMKLCPN
jgi:hypothetical protein